MSLLNQRISDFTLAATSGKTFTLSQVFKAGAKYVVIYFYPKDATPGCTIEGQEFRDLYAEFLKLDTEVVGVSRDTIKSHEKFKADMAFPFELLADTRETACSLFNVMKMKNMYGKEVRGVERSTFIIGAGNVVLGEWRGVKAPGHAQEMLNFVKAQ